MRECDPKDKPADGPMRMRGWITAGRATASEVDAGCPNVDPFVIADWRERLAQEPTITNRPVV